jgi:hypothetical protein
MCFGRVLARELPRERGEIREREPMESHSYRGASAIDLDHRRLRHHGGQFHESDGGACGLVAITARTSDVSFQRPVADPEGARGPVEPVLRDQRRRRRPQAFGQRRPRMCARPSPSIQLSTNGFQPAWSSLSGGDYQPSSSAQGLNRSTSGQVNSRRLAERTRLGPQYMLRCHARYLAVGYAPWPNRSWRSRSGGPGT